MLSHARPSAARDGRGRHVKGGRAAGDRAVVCSGGVAILPQASTAKDRTRSVRYSGRVAASTGRPPSSASGRGCGRCSSSSCRCPLGRGAAGWIGWPSPLCAGQPSRELGCAHWGRDRRLRSSTVRRASAAAVVDASTVSNGDNVTNGNGSAGAPEAELVGAGFGLGGLVLSLVLVGRVVGVLVGCARGD